VVTQVPDRETVMHCIERARVIHGVEVAEMLLAALHDAWSFSAGRGSDTALLAAGWLSWRAGRYRKRNAAVAPFLDRLAELSAAAWVDELTVQATTIPDYYPPEGDLDDLQDPARESARPGDSGSAEADGSHLGREPGLPAAEPLELRRAGSADPADPEGDSMITTTERRIAEAKDDDLSTWEESGGHTAAWPDGWNVAGDPSFIPRPDRPFYRRDPDEDAQLTNAMVLRAREAGRFEPVPRVTKEEAERVCHTQALRRAQALRRHAEHDAQEAQIDRTLRRCQTCGVEGDHTVRNRPLPDWRVDGGPPFTPRLCDRCAPLVIAELAALQATRVEQAAAEDTPAGSRGEAARAFMAGMEPRLSWVQTIAGRVIR